MTESRAERWFYLDGFEANEFCPLWRYLSRFIVELYGLPNWCRVHYEYGEDQPIIIAPAGDYHHFALNRVNATL